MIINNTDQIFKNDNTKSHQQSQKQTPNNADEILVEDITPVDSSLLKAYVGLSADKKVSKQEIYDFFKELDVKNEARFESMYQSLADEDGYVSERAFTLLKNFQKKNHLIWDSLRLFDTAKENGRINYKALFLADSVMQETEKSPCYTGQDYCNEVLRNSKNKENLFDENIINFVTKHADVLKDYLKINSYYLFRVFKNQNEEFDTAAIRYADKKLSEGEKFSDIAAQIHSARDKEGNFSYAVKSINERLHENFEQYTANFIKNIALSFPKDKSKERDEFVELAISLKGDNTLKDTLEFISEIKEDKNSKINLQYDKASIEFIKNLLKDAKYAKDRYKIALNKLNIPYTDLSADDIKALKNLCKSIDNQYIETFVNASIRKAGENKGKFDSSTLDKYLDICNKNYINVIFPDIEYMAKCFALEENDYALETFQKLYNLEWKTDSPYGTGEKLDRSLLQAILSMLCLETAGVPKRPCYDKALDGLNKLMTMKLPMSSKEAFENFIVYQDFDIIEKLERVNLHELGLKTGQISAGVFQNATEEQLLHFKGYLKDYLKDKSIKDVNINLNRNIYSIVELTTGNNWNKTKLLYDVKKGEPIAEIKEYIGRDYKTTEEHDIKNKTISETRYKIVEENYQKFEFLESQLFKKFDENNNLIYEEKTENSPVNGVFNIERKYSDGSTDKICTATKDKSGNEIIEKNMKSLDGTATYYRYENDPEGNRILDYKITDKNGKTLLNQSVTFEVIDENHFVSSRNNKKFDIRIDNNKITIKNLQNNQTASIEIKNFTQNTDNMLLPVLKQFPGDELFKMKELDLKAFRVNSKASNASYNPNSKEIYMREKYIDTAILLHEWGHGKDDLMFDEINEKIKDDPTLRKIYNEEKQAFREYFGDSQLTEIGYFMADYHYLGKDSIKEGIAETNTLLNMYPKNQIQAIRAHYWQQYFPKTIAYLSGLLN